MSRRQGVPRWGRGGGRATRAMGQQTYLVDMQDKQHGSAEEQEQKDGVSDPHWWKEFTEWNVGGWRRRLFTVACLTGVWRENGHKGCLWLLSLMSSISSHEPLDWKDLQVIRTIGLEKWFKRSLHMLSLWLKASDNVWKYEIWILFHKNCTFLPPKKVKLCDCNSSFSH